MRSHPQDFRRSEPRGLEFCFAARHPLDATQLSQRRHELKPSEWRTLAESRPIKRVHQRPRRSRRGSGYTKMASFVENVRDLPGSQFSRPKVSSYRSCKKHSGERLNQIMAKKVKPGAKNCCTHDMVCMKKKREELYCIIYKSPRLPRVTLVPNSQHVQKDVLVSESRKSDDLENEVHQHRETCGSDQCVDFRISGMPHSAVEQV